MSDSKSFDCNVDNWRRVPLDELLKKLETHQAKTVLLSLITGVINLIKADKLSIALGEDIVFNLDVLLFCDNHLKDKALQHAIEYGMELTDVEKFTQSKAAVNTACEEIESSLEAYHVVS